MPSSTQGPGTRPVPPSHPSYLLPAPLDGEGLLARLAAHWPLQEEPAVTVERCYLDSFDWRLYRAGSRLQAKDTGRVLGLAWEDARNGKPMASCRVDAVPRWPTDIPPGVLRDAITPLLAMRALLPQARLRSRNRLWRVLNDDRKTVVRLLLEEADCLDGQGRVVGAMVPRLTLVQVKGYHKPARRLARFLSRELALPRAGRSRLEEALALQQRRPGDYSSKLDVALEPDMPAEVALRRILRHLLDTLQANLPGTRQDLDSEFLHDLRVATRRTRSALGQVKGVLPEQSVADFRQRFDWLGRVTGPTRDLDVFILDFPRYQASLPAELRADLAPLLPYLQARQREAQQALRRKLASPYFHALMKDWRCFLEQPSAHPAPGPHAAQPIRAVAGARLWRMYRRVLHEGRAIDAASPATDLHELRKSCKKLRYLLEFFVSLYPTQHVKPLIRQLKRLLDNLGEFQDLQVQADRLRGFGEDLQRQDAHNLPVVLAIGSLVADLLRRQTAARTVFATRFTAFDDAQQHALCRRLFKQKDVPA